LLASLIRPPRSSLIDIRRDAFPPHSLSPSLIRLYAAQSLSTSLIRLYASHSLSTSLIHLYARFISVLSSSPPCSLTFVVTHFPLAADSMVLSTKLIRAAIRFGVPISAGPMTPFERAGCEAALLVGAKAPFEVDALLVR
jgi:hypothetical protein